MFKIGGWKILQLSNRKPLEEFFEEAATVALLIGILTETHPSWGITWERQHVKVFVR